MVGLKIMENEPDSEKFDTLSLNAAALDILVDKSESLEQVEKVLVGLCLKTSVNSVALQDGGLKAQIVSSVLRKRDDLFEEVVTQGFPTGQRVFFLKKPIFSFTKTLELNYETLLEIANLYNTLIPQFAFGGDPILLRQLSAMDVNEEIVNSVVKFASIILSGDFKEFESISKGIVEGLIGDLNEEDDNFELVD